MFSLWTGLSNTADLDFPAVVKSISQRVQPHLAAVSSLLSLVLRETLVGERVNSLPSTSRPGLWVPVGVGVGDGGKIGKWEAGGGNPRVCGSAPLRDCCGQSIKQVSVQVESKLDKDHIGLKEERNISSQNSCPPDLFSLHSSLHNTKSSRRDSFVGEAVKPLQK